MFYPSRLYFGKAITRNKDVEFQFFVMTESEREKAAKAKVVPTTGEK